MSSSIHVDQVASTRRYAVLGVILDPAVGGVAAEAVITTATLLAELPAGPLRNCIAAQGLGAAVFTGQVRVTWAVSPNNLPVFPGNIQQVLMSSTPNPVDALRVTSTTTAATPTGIAFGVELAHPFCPASPTNPT